MSNKPDERSSAMAAEMAEVLPRLCAQKIEQAIAKLKRPKRTAWDKWFRKQWYRWQWWMRHVKGLFGVGKRAIPPRAE